MADAVLALDVRVSAPRSHCCGRPLNRYIGCRSTRSTSSRTAGETRIQASGCSSAVGFFAPKAGYAATGRFGVQVDEFKALVKELHRNGIEIVLDVVFNHTAEGNERGPTLSFRGIDNKTYYMLTPDGYYFNFSGTGNTLNCNNPIVRNMLLDCLQYWAAEYHIDGFRFDLAAILGRDQNGAPLMNPPLLESLAFDPILAKCKLIAEACDAGGLYQVGSFPAFGRWAESNGKYRDAVRRFIKGDEGMVGEIATRVQGSPDLYGWSGRGTKASINFITCHDGFTLADLVSYNGKHNDANANTTRMGRRQQQLELRLGRTIGRSGGAAATASPDEERARHPAGQPGRAHDPDGRRSWPHATATCMSLERRTGASIPIACESPTANEA